MIGGAIGAHGSGGLGVAALAATNQTALAAKFAPPKKKVTNFPGFGCLALVVAAIAGAIGQSMAAFWVVLVLCGIGVVMQLVVTEKFNSEQFPKLYGEWAKRMICLRCENVFSVEE